MDLLSLVTWLLTKGYIQIFPAGIYKIDSNN